MGVVIKALLGKEEVKTITVIEKSQDVIQLVASTYEKDPRVVVLWADAYEVRPSKLVHYDCVWHDIWDNICGDNLKEMAKLHRKYGRKCDWQGSWCKDECRRGY